MPLPNKWWHVLATFYFDSRTTRIAKGEVAGPSYTYEARLLSAGYLDRSIPVPSGLFQVSDAVIEIAETDRAIRDFLCIETPLRRLFSLKLIPNAGSEAAYRAFGTCEVLDAEFEAGKCRITGRDITWSWIDKPLPGLGNRTNFDYLMADVDEFFFPILQGIVESTTVDSPGSFQGQVLLPRMGQTGVGSPPVTMDRWALCQTPIVGITVYRKLPDEELFTVVPQNSPPDWVITEEEHAIDGITYDLQFLDFADIQPPGTQIRVDFEGIWFRGEFGSMAAIGTSSVALRNPVDFLINILYALLADEPRIGHYNIESFDSVRTAMETVNESVSPIGPYYCDGAITEPITAREFLGQFLTSFELDLFVNRFGEITLSYTGATDPNRPVFSQGPIFGEPTDNSLILINSVRERLANPHFNRIRYNFARNYAIGQWMQKRVRDNEADQLALGGSQSPAIPEVVEDTLEMWFVRDEDTARDVVRRRMEFLSLGSYRIELNTPLPEVFDDIELAKLIGITSHWGLAVGGYHNAEFKTTGLTYNLDSLMCTIRGVLRAPVEIEMAGSGWEGEIPVNLTHAQIFNDSVQTRYFTTGRLIDPADYVGCTGIYAEGSFENQTLDTSQVCQIVNESGTILTTITVTAKGAGVVPERLRSAEFEMPSVPFTPQIRFLAASESTSLSTRDVKLILQGPFTTVRSRFPLLGGDESTGGGLTSEADNNFWSWCQSTTQAAYAASSGSGSFPTYGFRKFLKEAGKWSGISSWRLEVMLAVDSGVTGRGAFFNATTGVMVTGTELTFTSTTPTRQAVDFADNAPNFTNGDEFEFRWYKVSGAGTVYGYYADLSVLCTGLSETSKIQRHWRVGSSIAGGTGANNNIDPFVRFLYESDKYQDNTTFKLESTAKEVGGGADIKLLDLEETDFGTPSADKQPTSYTRVGGLWTNGDYDPSDEVPPPNPLNNILDGIGGFIYANLPPPAWDGTRAYELTDCVDSGGTKYRCILAHTNQVPPNVTYWTTTSVPTDANLELAGFNFGADIPIGATIADVRARIDMTLVGANAQMCCRARIGGIDDNAHCNTESQESGWLGPPIPFTGRARIYAMLGDRNWVRADLLDGTFALRIRAVPNGATAIIYGWQTVRCIVTWGTPLVASALNFSTVSRERQRSGELTLASNSRYIMVYGTDYASNHVREHSDSFLIVDDPV